jgi:hypothetical protein
MSDTSKHLLIALLVGVVVAFLMGVTSLVPAIWQPVLAFATAFGIHYYLENAPAGSPPLPTPLLTATLPAAPPVTVVVSGQPSQVAGPTTTSPPA